jgi:carbonic anhydrase/acetyltransferase-like protein (isoleucine patch superfamily)
MGVPGKIIRELDDNAIAGIKNSALWYQKNMLRFKKQLTKI